MTAPDINPVELKVFLNHIYEYKKGVRQMVLYTTNRKYEAFAVNRLKSQRIKFVIQPVDEERINLFFGKAECINAIRLMVTRPLNLLTPEEDFILGAMLGYDICAQCKRYCTRKARRSVSNQNHFSYSFSAPQCGQIPFVRIFAPHAPQAYGYLSDFFKRSIHHTAYTARQMYAAYTQM